MRSWNKVPLTLAAVGLLTLGAALLNSAQAQGGKGKGALVLNITSGREDLHALTMAFQLANHALDDGSKAVLLLIVRAPEFARKDLSSALSFGGNPPLCEMLAELIKRGATVLVCPSCAAATGVAKADLVGGAGFATRESLFGELGADAIVFSY